MIIKTKQKILNLLQEQLLIRTIDLDQERTILEIYGFVDELISVLCEELSEKEVLRIKEALSDFYEKKEEF